MSIKKLYRKQILPIPLEEAWEFFATPNNLNKITPDSLTFDIVSNPPEKMYEGLIIMYKVSPFLGIKMNWVTEITHIKEKQFFVDEQRKGPYNIWHHEHHFKQVEKGTLMEDILHYDIGKSFLGTIAGKLFVDKQVENIFNHREKILEDLFPKK